MSMSIMSPVTALGRPQNHSTLRSLTICAGLDPEVAGDLVDGDAVASAQVRHEGEHPLDLALRVGGHDGVASGAADRALSRRTTDCAHLVGRHHDDVGAEGHQLVGQR